MSWTCKIIVIMSSIAALLIVGFAPRVSSAQENTLDPRLREIDSQRRFGITLEQMAKMEAQYLELLQEYDSPEDIGKIYAAIANSYINSGIQTPGGLPVFPDKVAEYCEKALQYPQDIPKRCRFYSFWGAALQAQYYKSKEEEFAVARRKIIIPYLKVLKLVFDNLTSREMQDPPAVDMYDVPRTDPNYEKIVKRHKQQLARRREIMLNRQLLPYLHTLMTRCVALYSRKPYATAELRRLAREILEKDDAVTELISAVEDKIKQTDPDYVKLRPEEPQSSKEQPEKESQPKSEEVPEPETVETPMPETPEIETEKRAAWLIQVLIIAGVVLAGVVLFLLLRLKRANRQ